MGRAVNPLLERKTILKKLSMWRLCAIMFFLLLALNIISPKNSSILQNDYVAQIWIDGFISDNRELNKSIENIYHNDRAKALIVNVNSPGGTFVGGEKLYRLLKKISMKKPVVALLGDQATSAAYLLSLGTDHIIAHQGTLTGSVGVVLQSFEITDLAKKIGITPIILKSNQLKATPHPAEKLTKQGEVYLQNLVSNSQQLFMEIVKERRANISEEDLRDIEQGKVYTGAMAKDNNLIDEIGGFDNAIVWLKSQNIKTDIIIDIDLYKKGYGIGDILKGFNFLNNLDYKLLSIFSVKLH